MKSKFKLFLFILIALVLPFVHFDKAHAEEGQYALKIYVVVDEEIKSSVPITVGVNFQDNEDSIPVSELTQGKIPVPNDENTKFKGWSDSSTGKKIYDENSKLYNYQFSSQDAGVKFCNIYAIYEGVNYNITLDSYGGTVNGESSIVITDKLSKFQTVDLSKYTAKREGCEFCGWGHDGKVITSIDKNYLLKNNNQMTVFPLYKSTTKSKDDDTVFILDANGGTIEGEKSKKYDYLASESASMPIFHYIPERQGFKFKGWNSKKDGSGNNYSMLSQSYWENDAKSEVESELKKDSLKDDQTFYRYLTLYAAWESTAGTKKEIKSESASELKGSVLFESPVDGSYRLNIKKAEIPEGLTGKNVKFVADISLINDKSEVVKINGIKMKIKMALPENLKGYSQYEVVYIGEDGKIKETLPATIEDGYIVFETNHLSKYGIVAKNISTGKSTDTNISLEQEAGENPLTGDAVGLHMALLSISSVGVGILSVWNRKKVK